MQDFFEEYRKFLSATARYGSNTIRVGSELQFPGFGDEIGPTPALVLFLVDQFEAGLLIDAAGGSKFALCPQHDLPVARVAGKTDALLDQSLADSPAAGGWFDQQQAEFGHRRGFLYQEDGTDSLPVFFRNPATLPSRIEFFNELGDDSGDESFEALVVSILLPVELAMPLDDPAHISGPVLPENIGRDLLAAGRQCRPNGSHRLDELDLPGRSQLPKHGGDLVIRARIERFEGFAAFPGQAQQRSAGVVGRFCFLN